MMIDKIEWLHFEVKYNLRKYYTTFITRLNKNDSKKIKSRINIVYAKKEIQTIEQTNNYIYNKIIKGEPFWVGRLGGNEMNAIAYYNRHRLFPIRTDARKDIVHDLCLGAGFFPQEVEECNKFVSMMMDISWDIDLIGIWNLYMEEWFIYKYIKKDIAITKLTYLEPWKVYEEKKHKGLEIIPWSSALEGKKVLVIHPFAESILRQYNNNREKIFESIGIKGILPKFELIVLKAVQTAGGEKSHFSNWFAALNYMINKCKEIDFDIAIVGCGAYGFPLSAEIKKMGKGVIHLGGSTQLMFGIIGKRWEDYNETCSAMINEHWVRPSKKETIKNNKMIEGGCYW